MSDRGSFGAGYADIDESGSAALIAYLDDVARIVAVGEVKRAASAALALLPGHSVLDVGCGSGVDLLDLASRVEPHGTVYGLDPSAQALDVARQRISAADNIELVRGSARQLPFGDGTLDACRLDRTLQHVPDPDGALAEVRRVLRPGGRIVVLEMESRLDGTALNRELSGRAAAWLWTQPREAWLPYMLPLLLSRAGFCSIEVAVTRATSPSFADADRALRLGGSLADAVAAGVLDAVHAQDWLEELRSAARHGELTLQMRFALIGAVTR